MDNISFSSLDLPLKASQIVCLDHQSSILYGEVIQLIPHRRRCWFRPLCLLISTEISTLIDLRSSPDLFWPDSLFRPALDTEIISLLPQLKDISHHSEQKTSQQKYLNQFIHLVWQAHQDKF
ncbi:MAG: hypothetical protein HC930_06005 [Hydrococcus sp. SU_1_0]|nr:hypothetical protein [Hydrococcus sp. SU_1_0]